MSFGRHTGIDVDTRRTDPARRRAPAAARFRPPSRAESAIVFLIGALLMYWLQTGTGGLLGDELGIPENDAGYHVRMSAMIPEHGLLRTFPWLQFTWFRASGDEFVSHHYGFHLLLLPFVLLSQALTGEAMSGGRWGITCCFGVMLAVLNALLAAGGIRRRWLWLALFLLMPSQFFLRHGFIRAICPSLTCILLIVLLVVRNRPFAAGCAVLAFTHLYLGGVTFTPVMIAFLVLSWLVGSGQAERFPWRTVACLCGGLLLGIVSYPYFGGMFEFLYVQVLGSGLTPDIPVGQEWKPYEGVWWFAAEHGGVLMTLLVGAIVLRMRAGPRLSMHEAWILLLNFGALALTLKARRFIEYWPALGFISAAWLLSPLIAQAEARVRRGWLRLRRERVLVASAARWILPPVAAGLCGWAWFEVFARGRAGTVEPATLTESHGALFGLAVGFAVLAVLDLGRRVHGAARWIAAGVCGVGAAGLVLAAVTGFAGPSLADVRNELRCPYDLPAIREMMQYIRTNSAPGEIIFTDDWDTFPIFFYHNTHNYFIVGLDPKFTHARRPDLWERYVAITNARTPATRSVRMKGADGKSRLEKIDISLSDIREHFRASWVICDRDHRALAGALHRDRQFASLVFPSTDLSVAQRAPYMVFRIHAEDAPPPPANGEGERTQGAHGESIRLGDLPPTRAEQGWGELRRNRSVAGGPLRIGGQTHAHGIGSHAPLRIEYAIPPGMAWFEAVIGVDGWQRGCGSVRVRIEVDGEERFASETLTSGGAAVTVRIPVAGAERLILRADDGGDGDRCDHVNFGSAQFVAAGAGDRNGGESDELPSKSSDDAPTEWREEAPAASGGKPS
ncbi:MAG: NPCBM/NEW2 domain-containing protein [Phycisphaerales bacterium]|nr:NPCBM/NEW2 domain-containing protein [Phycisphaerales bacterium]